MSNQFTNQDSLNDAVRAARQAELEAYRQRLIAADPDPTNYSPDYTERDGVDSNADGLTWVTDKAQWTGGAASGGSSSGTEMIAWSNHFASPVYDGGNSGVDYFFVMFDDLTAFGQTVVDGRDFSMDDFNGDMGIMINEPGIVRLDVSAQLQRADNSIGDLSGTEMTLTAYDNTSSVVIGRGSSLSTGVGQSNVEVGAHLEFYVTPETWQVFDDPTSTHNVMLTVVIRSPNNTDQEIRVRRFSHVLTFTPLSS